MTTKPTGPKKKPYRSPRLVVYGDLRRLTAFTTPPATKGGIKNDGGGVPKTKL